MKSGLKSLFLLALCACLCLAVCSAPAETDQFGNKIVRNPDGSITVVTDDDNPLAGKVELPDDTPSGTKRAPLTGDAWKAVLDSVAARNGASTPTQYTDPATGAAVPVEVVYMGVGRSMVMLNGKKTLVNTVSLKWETDAPEDKVLAMIRAPKDGYAWLRRDPNTKITNPKIEQVRTNSVVRVIRVRGSWTLVDHYGLRGYVRTGSLEFYTNDHTDFDSGFLSVKGRTEGIETVKIRSMDKSKRILGEYRIGTPITVFDIVDDWAEVDGCGFHGRILSKYVTVVKDSLSAAN